MGAKVRVLKRREIDARNVLVLENMPMVRAIAVKIHERLPRHLDLDDLIHAGVLGLFDAAESFDAGRDVKFSSFARHRIRGEILDRLRELDCASQHMRENFTRIERAKGELENLLQRAASDAEIAEQMGIGTERWNTLSGYFRNAGFLSLATRKRDDDLPEPDTPASHEEWPDWMLERRELKTLLESAIGILPERYQTVVRLYYETELTMKEIGTILLINESRVSQIHRHALFRMRLFFEGSGVTSVYMVLSAA